MISNDPLTTWSHVITWLIESLIFQKVYDHQNLQGSHLWRGKITHNVTYDSLITLPRDKLKKKYFLLRNAYDHQNW